MGVKGAGRVTFDGGAARFVLRRDWHGLSRAAFMLGFRLFDLLSCCAEIRERYNKAAIKTLYINTVAVFILSESRGLILGRIKGIHGNVLSLTGKGNGATVTDWR